MSSLEDLCPHLGGAHRAHLHRLMLSWAPLADISFADLLLCVPDEPGGAGMLGEMVGYTVVGHVRPTTSRSIYRTEMVGAAFRPAARPFLDLARVTGAVLDGGMILQPASPRIRVLTVPVRCGDDVIAVLSREFSPDEQRDPGELEMSYFFTFRRLAQMIAEGTYPFPVDEGETEESPRVSDGLLLIDAAARVRFASPNAVSVLSRLGVRRVEGQRLSAAGIDARSVKQAFASRLPQQEEIVRGDQTIVARCVPLIEGGELTGAVMLVRDITELRRRDRLLLSKDATIAEIHHRVKNNLQTISSLLRLQGRRVVADEARQAIDESVRRIRSIAVVHEMLSQGVTHDVPFEEMMRPLVRVVEESLTAPGQPMGFRVVGEAGYLPTEVATPLAVVLTELMQNAVEHGFEASERSVAEVTIRFDAERGLAQDGDADQAGDRTVLRVSVADNGRGVADDFDLDRHAGLGLTIVRSLVENDLGGSIRLVRGGEPDGGTSVELVVAVGEFSADDLAAAVGREARD